ncbi:hypothetical protein BGW80DRAFT_1402838 [Lactifluus volemus]|nr:hypothetical protein BGW80DRAFT_1402838 [Lactifluus volemus]
MVAEDITDPTFLFGDLNFCPDLSRLHADRLISVAYAQALVFDATSCGTGKRFVKFREAPIDFPPTFQYDVLLKYRRRPSKRKQAADEVFNPLSQGPHPEASEGSDAEKRYDGGLGRVEFV